MTGIKENKDDHRPCDTQGSRKYPLLIVRESQGGGGGGGRILLVGSLKYMIPAATLFC